MANINVVIDEVAKLNPDLARQIQKYVKTHSYGLVYEKNWPEAVRLYKKNPTVGDTVNIFIAIENIIKVWLWLFHIQPWNGYNFSIARGKMAMKKL